MIPKHTSLDAVNNLLEDNDYKATLINKDSITIREIWMFRLYKMRPCAQRWRHLSGGGDAPLHNFAAVARYASSIRHFQAGRYGCT